MDILYVTMSPIDATFSTSFRNRAVLRGLVELGHNVEVLTIFPYDSSIQIQSIDLSSYGSIIRLNKGINGSVSVPIQKKGDKNFLTKMISVIYHMFVPFDSSVFLIKDLDYNLLPRIKYDILLSSSDPKTSHLVGRKLIKTGLIYKKWIQYWGDPLANDITSKLVYPKWLLNYIEKNLMKGADRIVYVSPITLQEQRTSFKSLASKMCFVPIPFEKPITYPAPNNATFKIGYYGYYLSAVRNIMPLYNSVKKSSLNIHLDIVGFSDLQLSDCLNISIYPNSNEVSKMEAMSDLIVVILNRRGGQIPGKLYHLAATNKPVLVVLDGEFKHIMRNYIEGFNRFIICDNSEDSILEAIRKQMDLNVEYYPSKVLCSSSVAKDIIESVS
jgi:hypothetical protein